MSLAGKLDKYMAKKPMTIEHLATMVAEGFRNVDEKFVRLEEKLNAKIDTKIDEVKDMIRDIEEGPIFNLQHRVYILEKDMRSLKRVGHSPRRS